MFKIMKFLLVCIICTICGTAHTANAKPIKVGIDLLFTKAHRDKIQDKRVALLTNHTAFNGEYLSSVSILKKHSKSSYKLVAIFAPEHGIDGRIHAGDSVSDQKDEDGIPIYSLYGKNRRPTEKMLKNVDVIVCDMMDVGVRTYTYISTLCYVMEEAAKRKIPVIVLDRPNPINGVTVDGPIMEPQYRSFIGYLPVPLCHGMTIGELARLFNGEYKIGCNLDVIPMRGWRRSMNFYDTHLPWTPMSPHIPEPDSPLFYVSTNLVPEVCPSMNHGIGYTLPFKVLGATWIDANKFCNVLEKYRLPGVKFFPIHYKPFYGGLKGKHCQGVRMVITNAAAFKPVATQFIILDVIKKMYPEEFKKGIQKLGRNKNGFMKVIGSKQVFELITSTNYRSDKIIQAYQPNLNHFLAIRKKYLIKDYIK